MSKEVDKHKQVSEQVSKQASSNRMNERGKKKEKLAKVFAFTPNVQNFMFNLLKTERDRKTNFSLFRLRRRRRRRRLRPLILQTLTSLIQLEKTYHLLNGLSLTLTLVLWECDI